MISNIHSSQYMQILTAKHFITLGKSVPMVDVRSPGEFADGHITGSINIPIFNDEERSVVGTIFKNKGRLSAIEKGLEIVGPKMVQFVRKAVTTASNDRLLVYCWRGGMRSESMAWLFERVGINCSILQGGYKSYRNCLLEMVGNLPHLVVIEGYTGSGKTDILLQLKAMGEQIIDLEGLANHRGSVFGGIGREVQPTTQQFQNNLFDEILNFDLSRRIWVEGESQTVGRVFLPDPLWLRMNESECIEILVPIEDRIRRLVTEYGTLQPELMENAIVSITKRLGDHRMKEILQCYRDNNLESVASMLLAYYDQTYRFSRDRYKKRLIEIALSDGDAVTNAELILEKVSGIPDRVTK
jgi:tRNA 2-selenouridine synthase